MNSIRISPPTNAEKLEMWNGLNQEMDGVTELAGWWPVPTRMSAVTDNTSSMTISTPSSTRWNLADTSMPR